MFTRSRKYGNSDEREFYFSLLNLAGRNRCENVSEPIFHLPDSWKKSHPHRTVTGVKLDHRQLLFRKCSCEFVDRLTSEKK